MLCAMSWNALAEARIQEWLRAPVSERCNAADPGGAERPLEVFLIDRIERELGLAGRLTDPISRSSAEQHVRDLETQLFALLDATGRSVLAPLFAARIDELRAAR